MLRNAARLRRGALLVRGPGWCAKKPGSRICGAAFRAMLRITAHAAPRPGNKVHRRAANAVRLS
jgi:hypothetical protein